LQLDTTHSPCRRANHPAGRITGDTVEKEAIIENHRMPSGTLIATIHQLGGCTWHWKIPEMAGARVSWEKGIVSSVRRLTMLLKREIAEYGIPEVRIGSGGTEVGTGL
jgi:hypothetical protein